MYSQNYTYLFCIMVFSAGMPILYLFGFVAYMLLYFFYKGLLVKYYQKTTTFNEGLPVYSIGLIRIALILHIAMGLKMYTSNDLFPVLKTVKNSDDDWSCA